MAQRGDEVVVEVGATDELAAIAEQELAVLAGLAVGQPRLRKAELLPGPDELADDRVDGLVERPGGLVVRHVEQADRVGLAGGLVVALVEGDAVGLQAADLVDAQARKQPGCDQGADHLDRVEGAAIATGDAGGGGGVLLEVLGGQRQPGGHQLGPGRLVDDPRVGADLGADRQR